MVVETPVPVEVSISDERQKEDITRRIQKYLQQQGEPQDDVFPEYVFVMISNRKTKEQVMGEVNPFLGDKAYEFVDWLWRELGSKAHKSPAQKEAPQSVFRHIQTHERDNRPKSIVSVVPKSDAMHDDSEEPEPFISARLFGRSLHTIKHQAEKMPTRARKISPQAMRSRQHAKVEAQTENSGGRDLRQRIREIQETQHSELASDRRQQLLDAQRGLGPGPLLPKPFSPNSQSPPLLPLAPSGGANMGLMRLGPVLEPGVRPGGAGSGMGMGPAAGQGRGLESGTRVGPGRGDGMQMGPGMGMGMGMGPPGMGGQPPLPGHPGGHPGMPGHPPSHGGPPPGPPGHGGPGAMGAHPPADEPAAKRPRTELDSKLIPESDFLRNNPSQVIVMVKVSAPNLRNSGSTIPVTAKLQMTVGDLKQLILEQTDAPTNKQKLNLPEIGFLKDNFSLAYYNLKNNTHLDLTLKERGGRKK
eukprot:Rmarinus@m.26263